MTQDKILLTTLAIVSAINEVDGAPCGHIYAALMSQLDFNEFEKIQDLLVASNLVNVKNHFMVLTEKGKKLVADVQ